MKFIKKLKVYLLFNDQPRKKIIIEKKKIKNKTKKNKKKTENKQEFNLKPFHNYHAKLFYRYRCIPKMVSVQLPLATT